jgi:hypothetical protein
MDHMAGVPNMKPELDWLMLWRAAALQDHSSGVFIASNQTPFTRCFARSSYGLTMTKVYTCRDAKLAQDSLGSNCLPGTTYCPQADNAANLQ